jgi:hypothetical protein
LRIECGHGRYDATIALLDIIRILYEKSPTEVNEDYVRFVCNEVFAAHDMWRYRRLEQRWTVALKCMQVFMNVVELASNSTSSKLVEAFCKDRSLYQVSYRVN